MKKISKVILASLSSFSFLVSCKREQGSQSTNPETTSEDGITTEIAETSMFLAKDGVSEYRIVIPNEPRALDSYAASELQRFFLMATGVELPIISDSSVSFDLTSSLISLGQTNIWASSGLEITDKMGLTGYHIKRFGHQVVINAKDDNGVVDGIYDFLRYEVDLKIYSHDEYAYNHSNTVKLRDFNLTYIPMVDNRELGYKSLNVNSNYRHRMHLYVGHGTGQWITFAHTVIGTFLPLNKYRDAHPDWYNSAGTQICYSNHEVVEEVARQVKNQILSHPDGQYIMIGHEDNHDMCECEACIAERKKYGNYAGQELNFVNQIQAIVDPWLHETQPGRVIKYVFFGYITSAEPPMETDANGNYVPMYKDITVNDNVMVQYCPIEMNFAKPITDIANSTQKEQLAKWGKLFEYCGANYRICIWTYSLFANSLLVPLPDFGVFTETYRYMADNGVSFLFDQANYCSRSPTLEPLKIYTQTQAMYRRDFDYNAEAIDFLAHYYDLAGPSMIKYFHYLRAYYKNLIDNEGFSGAIMNDAYQKKYWSMNALYDIYHYMEEGIEAIKPLKDTNRRRYETLLNRLSIEECLPAYLLLNCYIDSLSQKDKETMWNILNTYALANDITAAKESSYGIESTIAAWKKTIFGGSN